MKSIQKFKESSLNILSLAQIKKYMRNIFLLIDFSQIHLIVNKFFIEQQMFIEY